MNSLQLKEDILDKFKPIIKSWRDKDIYVISLWVDNDFDNYFEPIVILGYNTENNYKINIEKASCEDEARLNFAFWLQNSEFVYGEEATKEKITEWIKENNPQYYSLVDNDCLGNDEIEEIDREFINILIEVVKELHQTGFIEEKFGKPIPILIHELEYYDKIAKQNIMANTLPVIRDFVDWIYSMYKS